MKFNWGLKIAFLYGGFVALILCMVGLTMREKVELVSKDYYDQELKYQDKINQMNRSSHLKETLSWEVQADKIAMKFPSEFKGQAISAKVYFFRPSDVAMDQTISLQADTMSVREVNTKALKKGLYKMQVTWVANAETYYNEGIIQVR